MGIGAMTGPWLIVKWACLMVVALYLLLMVVFWRVRGKRSRLPSRLFAWLGWFFNFVLLGVPLLFENVTVTRACFVVAAGICLSGIGILVWDLARKDLDLFGCGITDTQNVDGGQQVQTLKLS